MAAYAFRCETGHDTVITQSIHDDLPAAVACRDCGQPAKRQWQATPTVFHGGGFYSTDTRAEGRA